MYFLPIKLDNLFTKFDKIDLLYIKVLVNKFVF